MRSQIHGGQDGLSLLENLIRGNVPHRIKRDAPVKRFRFLRTFPQNPSNGAFGDMMSHNPVKKFRDSFYRRPAITRQRRHAAPDKFRRNQNYAQYPFPRRKKGVQQRKRRLFQFRIVRPADGVQPPRRFIGNSRKRKHADDKSVTDRKFSNIVGFRYLHQL